GNVMEQFLAAPGPAILDAIVDPNTAPMPGKISAEQAFKFAESIARGEPKGLEIVRTALKDRARELI
ncbi:MAG TPA: pyruvate oxidase, partial [Terriglobales bacterium]|nr:pyruvate oxidase [Terriglobales bacterium]